MSALKKLHEKNWRESLPVTEFHHPPNFPEFLQPLRDLRIQRVAQFYRGFLLFVFGSLLAWVSSGRPDLSSAEFDTCTGEMSIRPSRSRV